MPDPNRTYGQRKPSGAAGRSSAASGRPAAGVKRPDARPAAKPVSETPAAPTVRQGDDPDNGKRGLKKYMPTDARITSRGGLRERGFKWLVLMILSTLLQLVMYITVLTKTDEDDFALVSLCFFGYLVVQWIYYVVFSLLYGRRMELELIGFTLCAVSMVITASIYPDGLLTQFIATAIGMAVFAVMIAFLGNISFIVKTRLFVGLIALGLLGATLLLANWHNGAKNWLYIGDVSIQPSEFVKVAFVYVGAATLEKLQNTKSLASYIIFALACVGMLFLMYDFGTALIFFADFLMIAFMRSGDVRTIALVCAALLLGGILIIIYKPTVTDRFATYRHIWDDMNGKGMQQTRTIIYSLSGGLFGVGIGNGKLRYTFASTTDLAFGVVCEEMGLLFGFAVVIAFIFLLVYAIRTAKFTRSAYYAISGCAAAGMMLFQTALIVLGVTDILPFTGVTLPFVSRGGSSMIASWGLLAFIKAMDLRTYPGVMKELFQAESRG